MILKTIRKCIVATMTKERKKRKFVILNCIMYRKGLHVYLNEKRVTLFVPKLIFVLHCRKNS